MRTGSAHNLVVKTAKDMAGAVYEELAKDNEWYKLNPNQEDFIERAHGSLIDQARQVLAGMLRNPAIPAEQKDVIAEALILDNSLVVGRGIKKRVYSH